MKRHSCNGHSYWYTHQILNLEIGDWIIFLKGDEFVVVTVCVHITYLFRWPWLLWGKGKGEPLHSMDRAGHVLKKDQLCGWKGEREREREREREKWEEIHSSLCFTGSSLYTNQRGMHSSLYTASTILPESWYPLLFGQGWHIWARYVIPLSLPYKDMGNSPQQYNMCVLVAYSMTCTLLKEFKHGWRNHLNITCMPWKHNMLEIIQPLLLNTIYTSVRILTLSRQINHVP